MDDGYSYDLLLNLEVLKDYSAEANVMHSFAINTSAVNLNQFPYQATFYFNEKAGAGESLSSLIENTTFSIELSARQQLELWSSLMFLCLEIEKQMLNVLLNDTDYLELVNIGSKIIKIQGKKLSKLTVNRIAVDDKEIAGKVVEQTCNLLAEKFIKCAKFTPFRDKTTIEDIVEFTEEFRKVNETVELQILGDGADAIQTYLHNERLMISQDRTKLNVNRKSSFPLTNQQSEFIYSIFKIFKLLTRRKKMGLNTNLYIRNCIANYAKTI